MKDKYASGTGVADLARHFGRTQGALRSRLKKLGLDDGNSLGPTHEETRTLLEQGLTVEEVAERRGLAKSTIVDHLERLAQRGQDVDLQALVAPERYEEIRSAFKKTDGTLLTPVKELLGDDYTYEEFRMVRIDMDRRGELPG